MKKLLLLLAIFFAAPMAYAQDEDTYEDSEEEVVEDEDGFIQNEVVDGIVKKQHIKSKKPLQPAYVREANVLWSKTVWRLIDLRQKQNQYLYYPTMDIDERKSLARVLYDATSNGEITAYHPEADNEFEKIITPVEACVRLMKAGDPESDPELDSTVVVNPETGKEEVHYATQKKADDFGVVQQVKVKEVWYFDKRYGCLKVQILGLCPVAFMQKSGQTFQFDLFWVYYPEVAPILAKQEAYSYHNDAQRVSLRDKLETRQFDSYIYRASNVYNNRVINDISNSGIDQNLEAARIQNEIFRVEHDMWEF